MAFAIAAVPSMQSVSEPCDASSGVATVLNAGISEDPTGRRLCRFVWAQVGVANPTLQAIIDATNGATDLT
jgi:replication-associated recombination protein RarA